MTRSGLVRHLQTCSERQKAILAVDKKRGKPQQVFHLQVQDTYLSGYWLHLEVNGAARLEDLDEYLRAIWLECCGHMSQFSDGGWGGEEIPMSTRADRVFTPGIELTHIYDFGTSSETLVKVIGVREGKPLTGHPIFLMARNDAPEIPCQECDEPAAWLCLECQYELNEPGALCEAHAASHEHEQYGDPMALVNSPRVGMCGYEGPAEAPY